MKRLLQGLFIGTALLVLSARPAAAQDLSGGYALVTWNGCCAHGFMIDYAHVVHTHGNMSLAPVVDFGWTRFSAEETDTTFAGGARFNFLTDTRCPVHGQVTVGVVHWSEDAFEGFPATSGNDFIMGFGGGTIIKATDTIGIKPQVDFFLTPTVDTAGGDKWFFRFSVNAVIKVGK